MYRAIKLLDGLIPKHIIERSIHGLRFILPDGKKAEFVSEKLLGITVFRKRFDEFLARRAAQAGANLLENAKVVEASANRKEARVSLSDGREFTSDFLIGADGVNSIIGKSLGLRPKRKDLTRVGLGMESDIFVGEDGVEMATGGNPSILEILPVEGRVSYGWVFPKKEHLAIGVAGAAIHMHPLRPMFDYFCMKMQRRFGLDLKVKKRRTYFLGADGVRNKNVTTRALLIGDAAGFVDPMMGEGIAYAMKSGVHAAHILVRAIEDNRYDEEFLSEYQRECVDEFADNFAMAAWAGMRGVSFAEFVLTRASGHRLASDIMAMVARGEIGYSAIPYIIARRLPRELPGILRQIVQSRLYKSK